MTEIARSRIEIDGTQAQKSLTDLERRAKILRKELKEMRVSRDPGLKNKQREFDELQKKINATKKGTFDLNTVLRNLSGASIKELTRAQSALRASIRNTSRATEEGRKAWAAKTVQLKAVQAQLAGLNSQLSGLSAQMGFLQKAAYGFNRFFGIVASTVAALMAVVLAGRQATKMFAEFDDKVADAMKVTKKTREEIYEINEELKKISTRTAQDELIELAWVAGKLGIKGREDIIGFVNAANQISVALKKDLGGNAETAVREIGKLSDIFKLRQTFGYETSMLKISSAINELGMASTASEGYLVEFAKRSAGIAVTAKITAPHVLGLAATLDQLGQQAETSGTVYSQALTGMFRRTEEFAKVARMPLEDFRQLMNENANEAFIRVLEGVRGTTGGMQELVDSLGFIGLEGRRATGILSTLANSTEVLRIQQQLATQSFWEGTSVTNEYNIKNNTALAKLEKLRKVIAGLTRDLGAELMPVMTFSTSKMSYLIRALLKSVMFFKENRVVIISTTRAIIAYTLMIYASTIAIKLWTAAKWMGVKAAAAFNAVVMKNPYVFAAAAIIGLITWVVKLRKESEKLTDSQKAIADVAQQVERDVITEAHAAKALFSNLSGLNEQSDERRRLIGEINERFAQYLPNLLKEEATVSEIKKAYDDLNSSIRERVHLDLMNQKGIDIYMKAYELNAKREKQLAKFRKHTSHDLYQSNYALYKLTEEGYKSMNAWHMFRAGEARDWLNHYDTEIKKTMALYAEIEAENDRLFKLSEQRRTEYIKQNYERQADALSDDTQYNLTRKIQLYNDALKHLKIGSDAYLRVLEKIKATQQLINELFPVEDPINPLATEELINAYDELGKKISAASSAVKHLVAIQDYAAAKSEHFLLKNYEAQKLVLDGIIKAGGSVETFLDDLTDSEQALLEETISFNEKFSEDFKDIFLDIAEFKKTQDEIERDRIKRRIEYELEQERKSKEQKEKLAEDWRDSILDITYSAVNASADIYRNSLDSRLNKQIESLTAFRESELNNEHLTAEQRDAINIKYDRKEAKLKTEAFKRQKNADIIASLINTGLAISRALSVPPGWPLNAPSVFSAGIAAAAQTAVIAAQPVPQFWKGRYFDIVGQDDNKTYHNIPYTGAAQTGIYDRPALVAEKGSEIIIDAPTTKNIRLNYPEILAGIKQARVPQYASGKYPSDHASDPSPVKPGSFTDRELILTLKLLKDEISKGIRGKWVLQDFTDIMSDLDDLEKSTRL